MQDHQSYSFVGKDSHDCYDQEPIKLAARAKAVSDFLDMLDIFRLQLGIAFHVLRDQFNPIRHEDALAITACEALAKFTAIMIHALRCLF